MKYRGKILTGVIAILVGLLMAVPAFAADADAAPEAKSMEKMQVTSTRTQKKADLAPASVSVITKEDMEVMQINTIDEALRYEKGVYLDRPGGLGDALPATTMRGLPGDERSLIMVDGIPVNDPYSSLAPYNMIDPNAISQIEVVLGPGSALYGGNAVGGSVNLITKDPKELEAGGRLGCGTYNNQKAGAWVGDKVGDKFTYRITMDWEAQEGYPTQLVTKTTKAGAATGISGGYEIDYDVVANTDQTSKRWAVGDKGDKNSQRYGGSLRTTWKTTDTGKLTFLFMGGSHSYEYDAPHSYISDGNDFVFSGVAEAGSGQVTSKVNPKDFLAGKGAREYYAPSLKYEETFGNVDITTKLAWQKRDSWYTSLSGASSSETYYSAKGQYVASEDNEYMAEIQGDYEFNWMRKHVLTAGLFYKQGVFEQETTRLRYYQDEGSTWGGVIDITEGDTTFLAPFLQVEWSLHDKVTLYTGARIDWWWAKNGKSGDPKDLAILEDKDKSAVSPRVSAVWEPVKGSTFVRASIGQAFKPPTIYDLFRTWTGSTGTLYMSNPDLDPETMWNYEIGVDQYLLNRKIKLGGTVFYSQVQDLITSRYIAAKVTEKTNVGEVDIIGFEADARVYPTNWMQFFVNYGRYESEIKEYEIDTALEGKSLLEFPRDLVKVGTDFRFWKFQYSIFGQYFGKTYWEDDNSYTDEECYNGFSPHWEWDTKLTFNATDKVHASVAVNNVFDEGEYWGGSLTQGQTVYGEIRFEM
ncbi:iron complex outermembrane recepter protein [Desulfatibacillum alkenivorans DSM 16219]|jgi:iron complex outermembrane receptor protein|uniref:Iron complex outermembrane recepter protein n=1 Tax=Desulfatibacillum alkenivorans DSM 16219 TaxID=1121393 RepID=A0A1M6JXC1_9BACT|nr:TonB-dependent receptor [Desulfatibacillum alkenivorans]SHJ51344.1 iron complex outermembrane recepter protein [Desulfatibacillum alkenivorans DSM 16219]